MSSEVRFNLQEFLAEMRREQAQAHQDLTTKVDAGFKELAGKDAALDKRIDRIETGQSRTRWLVGTVIAIGGMIIAWFKS